MKVVVDSWAWLKKESLSELQLSKLRTALTVVPRKAPEYPGEDPGPLYLYTETPELFGVAREYFLTNRKPHHEFVLNVANGDKSTWPGDLKFNGKLREEQGRAVEEISQRFKHGGLLGGMLKASPGWGKCCTISSTYVILADGSRRLLGDLIGTSPEVVSMHSGGSVGSARASQIWHSGSKECARLVLGSGQWFEASLDHPILTQGGWVPLGELKLGREQLVAAARWLPEPPVPLVLPDAEVIAAGLYLCDGTSLHFGAAHYCKGNAELVALFEQSVSQCPGFTGFGEKQFERGAWYVRPHGMLDWLRKHTLNLSSKTKRVPPHFFRLPNRQLALLLRALFTDGNLYVGRPSKIEIALASEGLIDDIYTLLLRFGIVGRKSYSPKRAKAGGELHDAWRLQLADRDSILSFLDKIGPPFGAESQAVRLIAGLPATTNTNWDVVPVGRAELKEIRKSCKHLSLKEWQQISGGGGMRWMSRTRFQKLVSVTGYTGEYAWLANADLVWESVREVRDIGVQEVADLTVPETENVIANGMVVHNTVASSALIAEMQVPTLVVVHKEFLMAQWRERLTSFLPGVRLGLVQQDECTYLGCHVVLAMVHTLANKTFLEHFIRWPGLVITDECFPSGTVISTPTGPRTIETLAVGDPVVCAAGIGAVTKTFARVVPVGELRLVSFEDGSEQICTAAHPFLTLQGWTAAAGLESQFVLTAAGCFDTMYANGNEASAPSTGDMFSVSQASVSAGWSEVLLSSVYGKSEALEDPKGLVRAVWSAEGKQEAVAFLFRCLSAELVETGATTSFTRDGATGQAVAQGHASDCYRGLSEDAEAQSDAPSGSARQGEPSVTQEGASFPGAWGEREGVDCSSAALADGTWRWVGGRARGSYGSTSQESEWPSGVLQVGPLESEATFGDRSGWTVARGAEGAGVRSQERDVPAFLRVVRVTVPESRDLERLGICVESDSGGVRVHNLTVDRHPSYVLSQSRVLVHNCHRVGAATWSVVPAKFPARWRLGITATPRRKDGAEKVFQYHIGEIVFSASEQRMKPKIRRVHTTFQVLKTPNFNPALMNKSILLKFLCASQLRNRVVAMQVVMALQAGRKVLVLSERLNHLEALHKEIETQWGSAAGPCPSIDYYVGGRKEKELAVASKARVILATSQFAQEGLDIPALDTLVLSTPLSDVEQAVGRILRPFEGKKDPIVVDIRDDKVGLFRTLGTKRDVIYERMT